ncbi:uncharacterized protein [Primulina eburnea]|uniref:uncharacterized protein n=1 Tax=Primulina eburnea TaxID=1245227 RepID=UPI003C6CB870
MDLIGKIYLASSKGHSFILVATMFFTKWVEAVPLKRAEQGDVINFVKENIINRFGIPESLTKYQGTMFTGSYMREFAEDYEIKLINSFLITHNSTGKPKHQTRASERAAIGVSSFSLTFGHDVVLPLETMVPSIEVMIMELEEVDELRIQAYNALLLQKRKVARIYNKRINKKSF